jgi:hypothetical protein
MPRPTQTEIRLRLIVETTVPNVLYSLQDKASAPVDAKMANGETLVFEFSLRVADGPKFYGPHARGEGKERQFIYVATGQQAGQQDSIWSRRMKVDIHTIPASLVGEAKAGKVLEASINGIGSDGTPACATSPLLKTWRAL